MDNPKFNQVMNEIFQSVGAEAEKIEPTISMKLQNSINNCFSKSNDNPDRFANCMMQTQKKITDITESFQFKNVFLGPFVQNCLNTTDNVQKCTNQGKKMFSNIIGNLLKQVEKI